MFLRSVLNALKTLRCKNAQPCVTQCECEMANQVALVLRCNAAKTVPKTFLSQPHPPELRGAELGEHELLCCAEIPGTNHSTIPRKSLLLEERRSPSRQIR